MIRQVTAKQRATEPLGDLVPQLGLVMIWDQGMEQWIGSHVAEATSLVSSVRHANQMKCLVHTQGPPKEQHMNVTIPQPWSSCLALPVKYAQYIKINVQTEGLTVAQSRPGKCLNHSVGGETARGVRNVPGAGTETTPGNGTVGSN